MRTFYTAYNVAEKKIGLAQATNKRTTSDCTQDASVSVGAANAGDDGDSSSSSSGANGDKLGTPSAAAAGSGGEADGLGGEQTSVVAIAVAAGLVTMGLISCGVVIFAVRQRFSKAGGAYRPAVDDIDGVGGGGFEMSSGGKGEAAEREGDFFQASPRTGVRGGTGADATAPVFGRLLGGGPPARAGFAAFENAD